MGGWMWCRVGGAAWVLGVCMALDAAAPCQDTAPVKIDDAPVQLQDSLYTVQQQVRLVVLDVVVTDKKGNIVRGLKRDDFHVTEGKDAQAVRDFEATESHRLPDGVTVHSTAELDRLAPQAPATILVLDEFNTRYDDMAFARYALKKFLAAQPDTLTTPTMLLAANMDQFTVLRDYTQDKQELVDALEHHRVRNPIRALDREWTFERFAVAFKTLERIAEATQGHAGHKNLIWIGRGFPTINMNGNNVDSEQLVESSMQECVNMLRDSRITLYSIDPAGPISAAEPYGRDAARWDPTGGSHQFTVLAEETGGGAMYGTNDVDQRIATTVRDGESFYTLTYRPTNASEDPTQFRKINVVVDVPGVSAMTRKGYYVAMAKRHEDPKNPSRQMTADLLNAEDSTMVYDGLGVSVTQVDRGARRFRIHLDAEGVVWADTPNNRPKHAEFVLLMSMYDKKGVLVKRDTQNLTVVPEGIDATGGPGLPLEVVWTELPDPKAVRIRFVVRMQPSGRMGSADVMLVRQ